VDPNILWQTLGGGAIIAAALALARLLLDYGMRGGERRIEHEDNRRRLQRDAEARLERILQDRLADADRRLERFEQETYTERMRAASLEHEHARLLQAYGLLKEEFAALQAEYTRLVRRRLPAGR
jgi:C4-dicarboxylate-specific signal transduction histidine kinase